MVNVLSSLSHATAEDVTMSGQENKKEDTKLNVTLGEVHSHDPKAHKQINISCAARDKDVLKVTFHRTVRVPDNENTYQLPPSLSQFPFYSVQDYNETFPQEMAAKGGIFFPCIREAMWISFTATRPFATKVYIGGINAISGEPKVENLATLARWLKSVDYKLSIQDYLVAGPTSEHQDWIDGIIKENGSVAQFVAMPQGSGDTVEEQISGQQTTAGLQIEVVRIKSSHYMTITIKTLGRKDIPLDVTPYTYIWEVKKMIQLCEGIPPDQQKLIFRCQEKDGSFAHHQIEDRRTLAEYFIKNRTIIHLLLRLRGGSFGNPRALEAIKRAEDKEAAEMGIAAGGCIEQVIRQDYHPGDIWDKHEVISFNVQILNASVFPSVTGLPAPHTPINATTYAFLSYPFFKVYDEPTGIVEQFEGVKTVAQKDAEKGSMQHSAQDDPAIRFPTTVLDPNPRSTSFRPVGEMEAEIKAYDHA